MSSSPVVISAAMRRSSSASWSTASAFWPMNALRSNTSRGTPSSASPAFCAVMPATGVAVPV